MTWVFTEPAFGDMIRVKAGSVYHYGIFLSEDEILQFGKNPSLRGPALPDEVEVLSTDIDDFLAGGFLEVASLSKKEKKACRTKDAVAAYARARLGEKGYHVLYHNCEHFATAALFGRARSLQAEALPLPKEALLRVYLAVLPEKVSHGRLYPSLRDKEVRAVGNERLRREKFFAWKLLEYAFSDTFGLKMKHCVFTKDENGKWHTPDLHFSISHGGGAVAVAVGLTPIGVDIEATSEKKSTRLLDIVLTDKEKEVLKALSEQEKNDYFYKIWTRKEALFKKSGQAAFRPAEIESAQDGVIDLILTLGDKRFVLSVASENAEKALIVPDINL